MFGLNFSKSDMSALGQKQTWRQASAMSVLPPKADIGSRLRMSALCQ